MAARSKRPKPGAATTAEPSAQLDVEADSRRVSDVPARRGRGVRVEELMTSEVVTVAPERPATEAAHLMAEHDVGFLPVTDRDGSLVGVVTDRDLAIRVLGQGRPGDTRVEEVMTEEVATCHAADDLEVAERLMRENQVERLPVLGDDDLLAGVVSLADLSQYESDARTGAVLADVQEREVEPH